jgi:hypothetical protein
LAEASNLYKGLTAGLFRQATYTTTRLGVFNTLTDEYQNMYKAPPTFLAKLGLACIAGGVGAVVGTPAEVALIRMTSDMRYASSYFFRGGDGKTSSGTATKLQKRLQCPGSHHEGRGLF